VQAFGLAASLRGKAAPRAERAQQKTSPAHEGRVMLIKRSGARVYASDENYLPKMLQPLEGAAAAGFAALVAFFATFLVAFFATFLVAFFAAFFTAFFTAFFAAFGAAFFATFFFATFLVAFFTAFFAATGACATAFFTAFLATFFAAAICSPQYSRGSSDPDTSMVPERSGSVKHGGAGRRGADAGRRQYLRGWRRVWHGRTSVRSTSGGGREERAQVDPRQHAAHRAA